LRSEHSAFARSEQLEYLRRNTESLNLSEHANKLRSVHRNLEKALLDCNWDGLEDGLYQATRLYYLMHDWHNWLVFDYGPRELGYTLDNLSPKLRGIFDKIQEYTSDSATLLPRYPMAIKALRDLSTWMAFETEIKRSLIYKETYLAAIERSYCTMDHAGKWIDILNMLAARPESDIMDIDIDDSTRSSLLNSVRKLYDQLLENLRDARGRIKPSDALKYRLRNRWTFGGIRLQTQLGYARAADE